MMDMSNSLNDMRASIEAGKPILDLKDKPIEDEIIDLLLYKRQNVFLTGSGGTGKTFIVNKIRDKISNSITLSSTGVASLLIKGVTVHSFFKFGLSSNLTELKLLDKKIIGEFSSSRNIPESEAYRIYFYKLEQALTSAKLIIVDEVSMLRGSHLDMIYYRYEQFGVENMSTLLVGDLLQLPPVKSDHFIIDSPYFEKFKPIYLTEVKRTTDLDFIRVQHKIREGIADEEVLKFIKSKDIRLDKATQASYVSLFSLKLKADSYNKSVLKDIPTKLYKVTTKEVYRDEKISQREVTQFINDSLVGAELSLKVGCRIMFVKNSAEYVNGELGTLIDIDLTDKTLKIQKDNGIVVTVGKELFEKVAIESTRGSLNLKTVIHISQYPVILSSGISIHKSQSLSIPKLYIDSSRVFENGQFYVAISRATSPDNLVINGFKPEYIKVNPRLLSYYRKLV